MKRQINLLPTNLDYIFLDSPSNYGRNEKLDLIACECISSLVIVCGKVRYLLSKITPLIIIINRKNKIN